MNTLVAFIALLASVSLAVERLLKFFGKWVPALNEPRVEDPEPSTWHVLVGVGLGTGIALLCKNEVAAVVPVTFAKGLDWAVYPVLGLLASGGSSFWSELLEILKAINGSRRARAIRELRYPYAAPIASPGPVLVYRGDQARTGMENTR